MKEGFDGFSLVSCIDPDNPGLSGAEQERLVRVRDLS